MLSVKKVLAGRGAVDYHVGQIRRGLADYYLQSWPGPVDSFVQPQRAGGVR